MLVTENPCFDHYHNPLLNILKKHNNNNWQLSIEMQCQKSEDLWNFVYDYSSEGLWKPTSKSAIKTLKDFRKNVEKLYTHKHEDPSRKALETPRL